MTDIRDIPSPGHDAIVDLNFIRPQPPFMFRRHFRSGMRSLIMEVLDPAQVQKEGRGVVCNGIRCFPRADPRFMLRLFRKRFDSLGQAMEEIRRLRVVETYLEPDQLAKSSEFIVSYCREGRCAVLLCGLQQYAQGQALDPWQPLTPSQMARRVIPTGAAGDTGDRIDDFARRYAANLGRFIGGVRRMISRAGFIPDLAGTRNMVVTREANIRLVDINNVSRVTRGPDIPLDDKGYPVCDKSVEALWRMETSLSHRSAPPEDSLYRHFLDPFRVRAVAALDRQFHRQQTLAGAGR